MRSRQKVNDGGVEKRLDEKAGEKKKGYAVSRKKGNKRRKKGKQTICERNNNDIME